MHVASNLGLEASVFLENGLQTGCFLLLDHDPLFPYQPEVINLELFLTRLWQTTANSLKLLLSDDS